MMGVWKYLENICYLRSVALWHQEEEEEENDNEDDDETAMSRSDAFLG
jgi:hypothetical protein